MPYYVAWGVYGFILLMLFIGGALVLLSTIREDILKAINIVQSAPPLNEATVDMVAGLGDIAATLEKHTKLLEQITDESNLRTSILVSTHKTETGEDASKVPRHGERK